MPEEIFSPLADIPEGQQMQEDVSSPPRNTSSSGSLFFNPESSLPIIGKVLHLFTKNDSLGSFQGSGYHTDMHENVC